MASCEPTPVPPSQDRSDGWLADPIASAQFSLRDSALQGADLSHLLFSQDRAPLALATVRCAMLDPVSLIAGATGPAQMATIDAGAIAAIVGNVVARRPWPKHALTDEGGDRTDLSIEPHHRVAVMPDPEWSGQTLVSIINKCLFKMQLGRSMRKA